MMTGKSGNPLCFDAKDELAAACLKMLVRRSDIPDYLQSGSFYQALSSSDDEIVIPDDCCKGSTQINNPADLAQLLGTLRFWIVDSIPHELLVYVFSYFDAEVISILGLFEKDIPYLSTLAAVAKSKGNLKMRCACAAGNMEIVEYLLTNGDRIDTKSLVEAAANGNLKVLQYAVSTLVDISHVDIMSAAARGGHLNCLSFLCDHGCEWNLRVYVAAIAHKQWDCAIFAVRNGCPFDGHFAVWNEDKHLELVQAVHARNYAWNSSTIDVACEAGYLKSLAYLLENGCPWDSCNAATAAHNGHLHCLQYLHEHGCTWDELTCSSAAQRGQLTCLRYAHENGCPWDVSTCTNAVCSNHLVCLQYAHEHGCPWDVEQCAGTQWTATSTHNQLRCLKYMYDSGAQWDKWHTIDFTKLSAVAGGGL